MTRLPALVLVGIGGSLGSATRIALGLLAQRFPDGWDIATTLICNSLGSALIGILAARSLGAATRAFWMAGFCGGFTTFSMLSFEVFILLERGLWLAGGYACATLVLCAGSVALGYRLARP
jgi:fluoride exporter